MGLIVYSEANTVKAALACEYFICVLLFVHYIQALVMIGAAFGSLIGGLISDSSGRKAALLSAGAPCFVGWLLIAVAQFVTSSVGFKVMLLTGRALTGLSSGIFTAAVPVSVM